ncbi:hypothetical protein D018_4416A, partial [Vibrio parahaemolyticus VP2007-007]
MDHHHQLSTIKL